MAELASPPVFYIKHLTQLPGRGGQSWATLNII